MHRQHYVWVNGACFVPCHGQSLSGRPLPMVGKRERLPTHPAVRPGAPTITHKKAVRMRREAAGIQALSDGRWRVEKVLAARLARTGGVLVQVRWSGHPRHPDSEVALRNLSADLRREARVLLPKRRPRRRQEADEEQPRRSARVRAVAEQASTHRRSGRLREQAAAVSGTERMAPQAPQADGESEEPERADVDGRCWGEGTTAFYTVEEILDKRDGAQGLEYRVRWGGTDPSTGRGWDPSWIAASQMSAALRKQLVRGRARMAKRAPTLPGEKARRDQAAEELAKRRADATARQRQAAARARNERRERREEAGSARTVAPGGGLKRGSTASGGDHQRRSRRLRTADSAY